jgi:hypothetical protein
MDRSLAELRGRLREAPDSELPPSIARLVAEHGSAAGTGARRPVAEPADQPPPAAERPLSDSEVLELESVQRRQLLDALMHGTSRANLARTGRGRGLWVGVAVALAIALVVALFTMVQTAMTQNASHRPGSVVVTVQAPH